MKKEFIIIRSNLKKSKGQTAAIAALILIAAIMLNLWLMLSLDYKANFDRYHDKLNAEHVTFVSSGDSAAVRGILTEKMDGDERTSEYEYNDTLTMPGDIPYNGGKMNSQLIFLKKQTALDKSVGKVEIVEDSDIASGIYLPMIYKTNDVAVGSPVAISLYGQDVEFTVCGFINSIMAGSHNCGMVELLLTDDKYAELEKTDLVMIGTLCSVRLKDKEQGESYSVMLNNAVTSEIPDAYTSSNYYDLVYTSRYISQAICSGIIAAIAFLVLLIALIVIASNIIDFISENIKKLGTLKAIGYTSGQLIATFIAQFAALAAITCIAGIGLSYCIFPFLNTMMIAQTGIPYAVHFLPLPAAIALLIPCLVIALTTWLSSRRIKHIEPIVALRQGILTHSFKRNRIPLDSTRIPLNPALAIKTALSGMKRNISMCVTMLVLSFLLVFTSGMITNLIVDSTPFLNIVMGETADSCISIKAEDEAEYIALIDSDDRVEKQYLYTSESVYADSAELMANICDDFSKVNNPDVIVKGRYPIYDNEIALGYKYSKQQGLDVGDVVSLVSAGKEARYLITGYTQIANNLGRDCALTREGYERLAKLQNLSYYLNLKDGVNIQQFNDDIASKFPVNMVVDIDSVVSSAADVYISLMTMISIAIVLLSVMIVAFVLFLLVRVTLSNKKRDYGILKSLGFTSGQLVMQTALAFMPAIIISAVVGLILGCFLMNPFISLFLRAIGIYKCTFTVPVGLVTAFGAGLIAVSFGMACLMSLRVNRIAPKELLLTE